LEIFNGAQLSSGTFGIGNAGNIIIEARDRATFKGDDTVVASRVERTGRGEGGDIRISTNILELFDDATLNASTLNFGDAGNILIQAGDRTFFDNGNVFNSVWGPAGGNGGDIHINTGNLYLTNGAALSTITYGKGDAGNIIIEAKNNVSLDRGGRLLSQVEENAVGQGGDIRIFTNSLLLNVARLNADTLGTGDAGNIIINSQDAVLANSAIITSTVDENGTGKGGNINISTGSFTFTDSLLATATLGDGNAGNVVINASNTASIDAGNIFSSVETGAIGQGGDINISTGRLSLTNGGRLTSATNGTGSAGNVVIEARDHVLLDSFDPDEQDFNSAIFSSVQNNGIGKGGDIRISTGVFSLTNGAQLLAVTKGQGNAGNVQIRASDAVNIAGSTKATGRPSAILTFTESGNSGGNITVDTSAFRISEGAVLDSRTITAGRGGNITINTNSLEALSGGQLQASTDSSGQAGEITINANANITISGSDPIFSERAALIPEINWRYNPNSGFYNRSIGSGIAGDIEVNSASLSVFDGGQIQASTFWQGKAGNVWINARDRVTMDGLSVNENGLSPSGIFSEMFNPQILGEGGNISIETGSLTITNGAQLRASTWGVGDGGDININAKNGVTVTGTSQNGNLLSGVFSTVQLAGQGNGGDINIQAGSLSVTGGAQLQTGTRNRGDAGNIFINTRDFVLFDGTSSTGESPSSAFSSVEQGAVGKGGNIEVNTGSLFVNNSAQLITSNNGGKGNGGNIRVDAALLSLTGNSQLRASTQGQGNSGNIFINASDRVSLDSRTIISNIVGDVGNPGKFGDGKGGTIRIDTGTLSMLNGSQLQASTFGKGDAGDIIINTRDNFLASGFGESENRILPTAVFSVVAPDSKGNGGNIRVNTGSLFVEDGSRFSASTSGLGKAGNIAIDARDAVIVDGISKVGFLSELSSATQDDASGGGGTITVNTNSFRVSNGGFVNAETTSAFRGGDVSINANTFEAVNGGQVGTNTSSSGNAGNIVLNVKDKVNLSGTGKGFRSGLFAGTFAESTGKGGSIFIDPRLVVIENGAGVSVGSDGTGDAGDITLQAGTLQLDKGFITAQTASTQGGNINLQISELLLLRNNSQISTTAGTAQAGGNGGNININSKFIVVPQSENSDITANAFSGNGGKVNINSSGIFGIETQQSLTEQSDITASSQLGISGETNINTDDTSSIQNSFTELSPTIDTNAIIASSCIARGNKRQENSFKITGSGALRNSPGDELISQYSTGEVRTVESRNQSWKKGDPIIEPQGLYRLKNGELLLSRECSS
ncbi:MAG: S-layer family protein, partial [Nostocales cyanobacterium 94392]|nr:S-layer family protein [Nostocales cyanobacterium 94392]